MKEYIEREAVKDAIGFIKLHFNGVGEKSLLDIINEVPAADVVERKRGEWVEWYPPKHMIMTGEELLFRCSCCDAKYSDVEGYRYCPYCGADMREVTE